MGVGVGTGPGGGGGGCGGGDRVGAWVGAGGGFDQQSRIINILSQHTYVHGDERHIHYTEQIFYATVEDITH